MRVTHCTVSACRRGNAALEIAQSWSAIDYWPKRSLPRRSACRLQSGTNWGGCGKKIMAERWVIKTEVNNLGDKTRQDICAACLDDFRAFMSEKK